MVEREQHFSPAEVAEMIDESEQTVRRMFDAGVLTGYRTETGRHRRIAQSSVDRLLARRAGVDQPPDPAGEESSD